MDTTEKHGAVQQQRMVTAKDLGDTVEMEIALPVVDKVLSTIANKTGYTVRDLQSTGLAVTMKTSDFIFFIQDVMEAHTKFQEDRANEIKRNLEISDTEQ